MKHFNMSYNQVVFEMSYINVMMLNATIPYVPRNKSKIRPHLGKADSGPAAPALVEPKDYEDYFNALNAQIK